MSDASKIEWTDATWNPVRGCTIVSRGCEHCYAMKQAHRFSGEGRAYEGLTKLGKNGPVWVGKAVEQPHLLDQPLRWKKPRKIFVCSMSDLFHKNVSIHFIAEVFAVMAVAKQHTFQVLTKRPERMARLLHLKENEAFKNILAMKYIARGGDAAESHWPLRNVWLGTSVEDQERADERVRHLVVTPAAVRFLSIEPQIGPVSIPFLFSRELHWVISGGESGPRSRPMHSDWARSIRDQCAAARIPYFLKQRGEWLDCDEEEWHGKGLDGTPKQLVLGPNGETSNCRVDVDGQSSGAMMIRVGKNTAGRHLDGVTHDGYPA